MIDAIAPVAPFDFDLTLQFVAGFGPMAGEHVTTRTTLTKTVAAEGRAVVVRVAAAHGGGDRERPRLTANVSAEPDAPPSAPRAALARVAEMLGAADDLAPFYARAAEDPAMAPLVSRLRGLHHVRFPSAFEAACWGLVNQRIPQAVARRMKKALVARAGARVVVEGIERRAFPEPAAVLALGEAEIARLVPGGRRAKAITCAARAFAGVDEAFLREAPIDEVRAWLRSIHGVGPFTSSFVLFRALGRFDGASAVSQNLVAAASRQYRRTLDATDVARLAAGYGAWGGYWMLYLWASTFCGRQPTAHGSARAVGAA